MRTLTPVLAITLAGCGGTPSQQPEPAPSVGTEMAPSAAPLEGVRLTLDVMGKSGVRFNERGKCFSCHHHAVPIVAFAKAEQAGLIDGDDADWQALIRYTRDHLTANTAIFGPGDGQVGTIGASYGLWALAEAGQKPARDTDPLIDIILGCQLDDGSWPVPLYRVPAEAWPHSATAMAVFALSRFAGPHQRAAARQSIESADQWLASAEIDSNEMEQLAMVALGLWWANSEQVRLHEALRLIDKRQQSDGGFPQHEGATSDVYATALATFALRENRYWTERSPGLAKARAFLESKRRPDGYWLQESRAAPVQRYFDNGDPGAREQFMTLFATAWAALAMTE